jgi:hypothetical protein
VHGALGGESLSAGAAPQRDGVRVTLLANYWRRKPLEPSCAALPDGLVERLGFSAVPGLAQGEPAGGAHALRQTQPDWEGGGGGEGGGEGEGGGKGGGGAAAGFGFRTELHEAVIREGADHMYFHMPVATPVGQRDAVYDLRFPADRVWGQIHYLNVDDEQATGRLLEAPEPKCVVFADKGDPVLWAAALAAAMRAGKGFVDNVVVVMADLSVESNHDALSVFDLELEHVRKHPAAVVHDSAAEDESFAVMPGDLTADGLAGFLGGYFSTGTDGKPSVPVSYMNSEL